MRAYSTPVFPIHWQHCHAVESTEARQKVTFHHRRVLAELNVIAAPGTTKSHYTLLFLNERKNHSYRLVIVFFTVRYRKQLLNIQFPGYKKICDGQTTIKVKPHSERHPAPQCDSF